jgi:RNA polymerase primary sigma factor
MNEDLILKMVVPYLKNNELTYDDFEIIFSMLSRKEQYAVTEILENHQIELVDAYTVSVTDTVMQTKLSDDELEDKTDEFEILYDENLFADDVSNEQNQEQVESGSLKIRGKVFLSNKALIKMIQEGDAQAKQDLCVKNRGLVDKIVNIYKHMINNKLDFEDLEQAGMVGLISAAERFDFSFETEFSTYATWWIKQKIIREIEDNGYSVRIPVHVMEKILKVMRTDSQHRDVTNYDERMKLISQETMIPVDNVINYIGLYHKFIQISSLDLPVGEEEETPLLDLIPDEGTLSVEEIVERDELKELINEAISTLKPREQEIIKLRFGFEDGVTKTLEEIGKEYGVTRERIRQIEEKALRKLGQPSKRKKFKDYLE